MGELILCSRTAVHPYYIEEASLNIYSLEELSYYIDSNVYLLTEDFMSEELCAWIEEELHLVQEAAGLRDICRRGGALYEFAEGVMKLSGYLEKEQIQHIVLLLKGMETKPELERMKLKADRYVENRRYISAIHEYRMLLERKDLSNEILIGNIWHNLGRAYVGVFLFQEAAECFAQGYELNENPETLREYLYACRYLCDEEEYKTAALRFGVEAEVLMDVSTTLRTVSRTEEILAFEQQLEKLFAENDRLKIGAIVTEWKEAYRKNCRI